jgi:hypothetical protein
LVVAWKLIGDKLCWNETARLNNKNMNPQDFAFMSWHAEVFCDLDFNTLVN